ncbi:MAG: FumA C-terminus/TtdB family hydratase beta subunit [Desulfatibacillaceae bacterium]|nr:FumA C-terminus/TtdB family hydratase beta subunit [Desulfatibacillaceae bacterium]
MEAACEYSPIFPLGTDTTVYRKLTGDFVSTTFIGKEKVIVVDPQGLTLLAHEAFVDVSHLLRASHLAGFAAILEDSKASENDKFVAWEMLQNARISAQGVFPLCQDTGTAIIVGEKGDHIYTGASDKKALSEGVRQAYTQKNLRYSQNAPVSMYDEKNTGCNLPAQIDIYSTEGHAYKFLFVAKGGGSANKTYLFQETKAILNPSSLLEYLVEKMVSLGTAACPPYHLAFVVGGTSAETTLKTVKLATTGYLDGLPSKGSESGHAFRDINLEHKLLEASRELGIGAQFGGRHFCMSIRVVRLPRHGASCPIGLAVSCSAHRNAKGLITEEGIFLEELETRPEKFIPDVSPVSDKAVHIDLKKPMEQIRKTLSQLPIATRVMLTGDIVMARDMAHAKLKERLDRGQGLPDYFKNHIIYYAGPAKTPPGYACGSCGPTTSGRMDPYVPLFQKHGASLVMLGKGNRSQIVTESCKKYGGFYLGSIGGPAARLGKDCITDFQTLEFPELGMEAIVKISVKDFPAFLIVDDKGHDFFANLAGRWQVLKASRFLDTL